MPLPKRSFFRIVRTSPPTVAEFMSAEAMGAPLRDKSPLGRRLWQGISVYATEAQARNKARQFPALGSYLAHLRIPASAPVRVERTVPRSRGHHTLWGEPAVLLGYVVGTRAVGPHEVT